MKHYFLIELSIIMCLTSCGGKDNDEDEINIVIQEKRDSIDMLAKKLSELERLRIVPAMDSTTFFTQADIDALRAKGFSNPGQAILDNLVNHPKLIPENPVLGGRLQYIQSALIRDKWVYARYSDGHIEGDMILKYEPQSDTSLNWVVVDYATN